MQTILHEIQFFPTASVHPLLWDGCDNLETRMAQLTGRRDLWRLGQGLFPWEDPPMQSSVLQEADVTTPNSQSERTEPFFEIH